MNQWERVDYAIDRVEQTLLVILLSIMILIAFLQIVLRNAFATGLAWGDPLGQESGPLGRFYRSRLGHKGGETH